MACAGHPVRLYYETAGDGPPLLFVGGTGGDLRHRPNVFDGPLPARFTVAAYDQRGLGRSDKPAIDCSMTDYADDAAGLLDHLGWDAAAVVGVSFGGMVAQELALGHPDRVRRLVLCCTSSGGAGGASYPLHELEDLPPDQRARRQLALADVRCGPEWQAEHPEEVAAVVELAAERQRIGSDDPDRSAGARRQLEARRHHDTFDRLRSIDGPVLVCGGRHDGIAPPANQEALAAAIPGARLEWFDGGHLFLIQDQRAFPTIVEFLTA